MKEYLYAHPVVALLVPARETPLAQPPARREFELPPSVWRGRDLGSTVSKAFQTGWPSLDAELPGGGWPTRSLTEILSPQPSLLEWRLLGGGLARCTAAGGQVVLVGPPKDPHLPGLIHAGLSAKQLVWIRADKPADRLWATEQLIKGNSAGAIVAWLPHARQEQLRRLQVCALACQAPVFLLRPESARDESSAAPLRLHARMGVDWELLVNVFKRRGPVHDGVLHLPSIPGGLQAIITPRIRRPSDMLGATSRQESVDVRATLGRNAARSLDRLAST